MYLIRFCRRLVWWQTEILFLTDLFKIQPANTLSPFSVFSSLSSVAKTLKRPRNPWMQSLHGNLYPRALLLMTASRMAQGEKTR